MCFPSCVIIRLVGRCGLGVETTNVKMSVIGDDRVISDGYICRDPWLLWREGGVMNPLLSCTNVPNRFVIHICILHNMARVVVLIRFCACPVCLFAWKSVSCMTNFGQMCRPVSQCASTWLGAMWACSDLCVCVFVCIVYGVLAHTVSVTSQHRLECPDTYDMIGQWVSLSLCLWIGCLLLLCLLLYETPV